MIRDLIRRLTTPKPAIPAVVQAAQVVAEVDDYVHAQATAQAATIIEESLNAVLEQVDATGLAYMKLTKGAVTPAASVIDHLADIRLVITQQLQLVERMGNRNG